ncbi:dTDP-4-dehydrorhamnose 3,5-epimerase [Gymnodinialimonas hymeniacidonis]|uniref:dTDP-4-dehydrorhamnose 3,5-epimerase n=1 Tax=Gymnodinialimonas hymeniacidonis TaxID=3126508 RepID=UPI0034C5C400
MNIEETGLPGLVVLTPPRFGDERGFFSETYNAEKLAEHGIAITFVQDNHSLSAETNTVRGLHFQAPPRAQAKLVRCGRGRLWDVAVDIRRGSPTYGQHFGIELTFENAKQLLIPAGFAHGFITREPGTEIIYKCSDTYAPETEGALLWSDPDLGIDWQLTGNPILSGKDADAPAFIGFESPFTYEGAA